ncbi:Sensor histidine kinase YesM [Paenibacillus sp. 1_12]|uniref:cache domain-containing sensor histidine kinase n=1 Tax=Paenibacillus sp. 1_12 TaxID=1566278 RepID=UPI0008E4E134|nr:histidine kinase [Paenibacillus sp. 1_12]SFK80913.1 Sensor histidine kinase YesM [Paenibacillus sp. 1_12]
MSSIIRFTYYRRIQISFLLLILLPTIAVTYINYMVTQSNVKDKIRLSNESVIALVAKDITKMIDGLTYASNFFVQDATVRNELRQFISMKQIGTSAEYFTYQQIKNFLSLAVANSMNTDILMYLVNNEGFIVQSSESIDINPVEILQQWESVKARIHPEKPNLLQWLGTVESGSNGRQEYIVSRVLQDPANHRELATLVMVIPDKYFNKLFQQIHSGMLALYDIQGDRIAGNAAVSLDADDPLNDNIRNEINIEKTGWKLIYETPKKEVVGEISRTFYISLLLIIPCFILFILISIFVAGRLYRPIRELEKGVKEFGNGNRSIKFQAQGQDEISHLGSTLNTMLDQINKLITDIEQEQEQNKVMELQALFSQIRPHFLLNTLNSIKCNLILDNDTYHSQKIDSLMSLLRAYMKFNEPTTLKSECKLLAHYADIMQMRNDIQLEFSVHVAKETEDFIIPKLLLQPLVENAFVHGFEEAVEHPWIKVFTKLKDQELLVSISDNGMGLEEERMHQMNEWLQRPKEEVFSSYKSIGLMNVLQRLRMTYGPTSSMSLESNEHGGVTVLVRFPVQTQANPEDSMSLLGEEGH